MLLNKRQEWDISADPNDLIGLSEELGRVLVANAPSIEGLGLKDYFVSSGGQEFHGQVSTDDLLDVVASLSKPLSSLIGSYTNFKSGNDYYKFDIQLTKIESDSRPVNVRLTCNGPSVDDADRLFKELFRVFTREIGRRNRLRSARPTQVSRPVPAASQAAPKEAQAEPTFWKVLTTNPFVVAVVCGLIVAGTVFLIGLYINSDGKNNGPATPPSTVTKTITTQITAPPGLPSPQVPGGNQSQVPGH
jgi:hypothetical protein